MIYTPIQEEMPVRCCECKDDACQYWSRSSEDEDRNPKCPLVNFVSREEASTLIIDYANTYLQESIYKQETMDIVLNKLGFKEKIK